MSARAETIEWEPRRGFWLLVLLADLIFLCFLAKITWIALALGLGLIAVGFVLRVEWLLAFLLLGMPFLAPLPLEEGAFTGVLLLLRGLFVAGWWVALGKRRGPSPDGFRDPSLDADRARLGVRSLGRVLRDPTTLVVLLLALLLWIGLAWSEAPRYGASKTVSIFLGNLFFFLAPFLLWFCWAEPRRLDRFLGAAVLLGGLFAAFGIASALGLAEQLSFGALVRVQIVSKERLAWLGVSQIWTARMLAVWLVLVLWSAQRGNVRPVIAAILVAVALVLMARTGSRGPLAALLLSPGALLLLPRRIRSVSFPQGAGLTPASGRARGGLGRMLRVAVPVTILVVLLIVLLLPAEERSPLVAGLMRGPVGAALSSGDIGEGISEAVGVRLAQDPSTIYRVHMARRSLPVLVDALPWGAGTGGFPTLLFMRDFRLYPHNIFAELLIENGVPGFLLFVIFLCLVWRSAWRLSRRRTAGRWLAVLFAMALLNAQVSGDVGTNEWIWFWAGMIGGMTATTRERRLH